MAYAPQRALFRRDRFFLSLDARLFVMLSLAQLRQNAGLFAQFFETTNGAFDGLVFANSNTCHKISSPPITTGRCQLLILAEFRIKSSNCLEEQGIYESPLKPRPFDCHNSVILRRAMNDALLDHCKALGKIGNDPLDSERREPLDLDAIV